MSNSLQNLEAELKELRENNQRLINDLAVAKENWIDADYESELFKRSALGLPLSHSEQYRLDIAKRKYLGRAKGVGMKEVVGMKEMHVADVPPLYAALLDGTEMESAEDAKEARESGKQFVEDNQQALRYYAKELVRTRGLNNAGLTKYLGLSSSGAISNAVARGLEYFIQWSAKHDPEGRPWRFDGEGKKRRFYPLENNSGSDHEQTATPSTVGD